MATKQQALGPCCYAWPGTLGAAEPTLPPVLPTRRAFLWVLCRATRPASRVSPEALAPIRVKMVSLQPPFIPMQLLLSRFWFSLRFALLAATVLLVLGLNQRAVSVLRLPVGTGETRLAKATVVKQKVLFEATSAVKYLGAPLAEAWLPTPTITTAWRPALRWALAVPRLQAGVRAGEIFRARLLAVALSPQAP